MSQLEWKFIADGGLCLVGCPNRSMTFYLFMITPPPHPQPNIGLRCCPFYFYLGTPFPTGTYIILAGPHSKPSHAERTRVLHLLIFVFQPCPLL